MSVNSSFSGTSESKRLLNKMEDELGRPLRVLHIGNIANNAYLNSKILRGMGVESDVLCYDYSHIMGCPEWEDADFLGDWKDDFHPAWHGIDLQGFSRPEWFIQGRLRDALLYIEAKHLEDKELQKKLSAKMAIYRILSCYAGFRLLIRIRSRLSAYMNMPIRIIGILVTDPKRIITKFNRIMGFNEQRNENIIATSSPSGFEMRIQKLVEIYKKEFSSRKDELSASELIGLLDILPQFKAALDYYDLIHAYATDGIYPLLLKKPFVAYEHGTIRSIPFEETTQGRLCALTYKEADYVAITNCDVVCSAQKLGIDRY